MRFRFQNLWIPAPVLLSLLVFLMVLWSAKQRHCGVQFTLQRFEDVGAVDWIDAPGSLVLFINITNKDAEPVWFRERVQTHSGSHWSKPESLRWLCRGPTWPGDDVECVAAVIPRDTKTVRLLVDCRHPTSYDAVLNFLNRRGLTGRFPVLHRWGYWGLSNLGWITGWHSVQYEFPVPSHLY